MKPATRAPPQVEYAVGDAPQYRLLARCLEEAPQGSGRQLPHDGRDEALDDGALAITSQGNIPAHLHSRYVALPTRTAPLRWHDALRLERLANMLMGALPVELGIRPPEDAGQPLVCGINHGETRGAVIVEPRRAVWTTQKWRSTSTTMVHFSL